MSVVSLFVDWDVLVQELSASGTCVFCNLTDTLWSRVFPSLSGGPLSVGVSPDSDLCILPYLTQVISGTIV